MPAEGAPVTLYGLISTVLVAKGECVTTTWDPDWQSLVNDGFMLVYDPPIDCENTASLGNTSLTVAPNVQSLVDNEIAAIGGGIKTGVYAVSLTGSSADAGSIPAPGFSYRSFVNLPCDTTQWRIHMRNRDTQIGTAGSGSVTINGVWFGTAPNGNPSSLTQVNDSFTFAGGNEYVGPWITDPAHQFVADDLAVVSYGIEPTTGVFKTGYAGGVFTFDAAHASLASPPGAFGNNTAYFEFWIEYQTKALLPRVIFTGDSISQGLHGTASAGARSWLAWPAQWGARHGGLVCNTAIAGGSLAGATGTETHMTTFGTAAGFEWDVAVIALGSNDIGASYSLATLQAELDATVAGVRSVWNPKRIYVTTVLPRSFAGAQETVRNDYNAWLLESASATNTGSRNNVGVIITGEGMANPASPSALRAADTMDSVHLTNSGQTRMANLIPARL